MTQKETKNYLINEYANAYIKKYLLLDLGETSTWKLGYYTGIMEVSRTLFARINNQRYVLDAEEYLNKIAHIRFTKYKYEKSNDVKDIEDVLKNNFKVD